MRVITNITETEESGTKEIVLAEAAGSMMCSVATLSPDALSFTTDGTRVFSSTTDTLENLLDKQLVIEGIDNVTDTLCVVLGALDIPL